MTNPAIVLAVASVVGLGVLMPGEVRIFLQLDSAEPDPNVISHIGVRNARLSGVQGVFQLTIIVVMVYLRWGGF